MSWAGEVYAAIRKIILLEDRVENLTVQAQVLADSYPELNRRLIRLQAKFALIEYLGGAARRALPEPKRE